MGTRDTRKWLLQVIVHDKSRNRVSLTNVAYSPTEILVSSKDLLLGTNLSGYIDEVRISKYCENFCVDRFEKSEQEKLFEMYQAPTSGLVYINHLEGNNYSKNPVGGRKDPADPATHRTDRNIDRYFVLEKGFVVQLMQNEKNQTEKLIVR